MEQTQKNNLIIIVIAVIVTTVVVGGGIYFWQKSYFEKEKTELSKAIYDLNKKVQQLEEENIKREVKTEDEKNKVESPINIEQKFQPKPYVRLLSPKGGETLCLRKNYLLSWENGGVKTVELYVNDGVRHQGYTIGAFPPDFNERKELGRGEYLWEVGKTVEGVLLNEGYVYTIRIAGRTADQKNNPAMDSEIFSIVNCEG